MARKLVQNVHVVDGEGRRHLLRAGTAPAAELAALVRNPHAWADGKAPAAGEQDAEVEVRVVVTPIPGDRAGYEDLVREDLDAICDARGIQVPSSANKPDVVDALLEVDELWWAELASLVGPAEATGDGGSGAAPSPAPAGDSGSDAPAGESGPSAPSGDGGAAPATKKTTGPKATGA